MSFKLCFGRVQPLINDMFEPFIRYIVILFQSSCAMFYFVLRRIVKMFQPNANIYVFSYISQTCNDGIAFILTSGGF